MTLTLLSRTVTGLIRYEEVFQLSHWWAHPPHNHYRTWTTDLWIQLTSRCWMLLLLKLRTITSCCWVKSKISVLAVFRCQTTDTAICQSHHIPHACTHKDAHTQKLTDFYITSKNKPGKKMENLSTNYKIKLRINAVRSWFLWIKDIAGPAFSSCFNSWSAAPV